MNEYWKPIRGYKDYYEISSYGKIRRLKNSSGTQSGRVLNPSYKHGYVRVSLCKNSIKERFLLHRLVCETFNGPAQGREVNHKDGNKLNNKASNFEWVSRRDNMAHMREVLKRGAGKYVLTNPDGIETKVYKLTEFCAKHGLNRTSFYTGKSKGWCCRKDV